MIGFRQWYHDHRGRPPWPWQVRLADRFAAGEFPPTLALPTGCGKTSVIDIWAWAISHALPVPRRLYWCIDRRVVVAQTAEFAKFLIDSVPHLQLAELRGGQSIDVDGIVDPRWPAVIVTTVDQLGSRLLWRPYGGISRYAAPIHAGLVGNDALIVLDEAHLSEPMRKTLDSVRSLRGESIPLPWHIMYLTATPRADGGFQLGDEDYAEVSLRRRLTAPKIPSVHAVSGDTFVQAAVSTALGHRQEGAAVIGIVVNTVRDARRIFTQLRRQGHATLVIGRVRPPERERRLVDLESVATGTRDPLKQRDAVFVVATSAIEVGADIDVDALITQTCPVSSLIQRLGRLNRAGYLDQARVTILHVRREPSADTRYPDEEACLKWVKPLSDLSPQALARIPRPAEPAPDSPPLLASDVALLAQTSVPIPIDISPWLHGFEADGDCSVVWRRLPDLDVTGFMSAVPVARREVMPCPIGEILRWLRDRPVDYLVKGNNEWQINGPLFPGALLVLPVEAGGYDEYGWAPDSREEVADVSTGEERYLITDPDRLEQWELGELNLAEHAAVRTWNGGLCVYREPWGGLPDSEPAANVALADHLAEVERIAAELLGGLPVHLAEPVLLAAKTHDVGKSDDRFQVMLGGSAVPLAKSATRSDAEAAAARAMSGLPRGWRHEMQSAAMLKSKPELVRYLVASHHGRGRSYLPAVPDQDLWHDSGGEDWHGVWQRQSEHWGHWGLAYLETLVRLSDWFASRDEAAT